jgi:hypothetical protein
MKKNVLLILIFTGLFRFFPMSQVVKQGEDVQSSFCISAAEMQLYKMINEYRNRFDLPPIPLSRSLCFVASAHVKDLYLYHPDQGPCNFHSWSAKGRWKPFCYPRDENKKNSVWDKPKELTSYKGKGYEIVYWENNPVTIDSIIPFWRSIDYFNNFLMNSGKWEGKKWNALGIAIYENYAAAWFGEVPDVLEEPFICGKAPEKKTAEKKDQKTAPEVIQTEKIPPVPGPPPAPVKPKPGKKEVQGKKGKPAVKPADSLAPAGIEIHRERTNKYYIVVKSQLPLSESKRAVQKFISEGYADAKILQKEKKLRVSILEFSDKAVADSALIEVKKTFKDAWLMKQ